MFKNYLVYAFVLCIFPFRLWGKSNDSLVDKSVYSILEINDGASKSEVRKAFRKAALKYHPDKANSKDKQLYEKMFQNLTLLMQNELLKRDGNRNNSFHFAQFHNAKGPILHSNEVPI